MSTPAAATGKVGTMACATDHRSNVRFNAVELTPFSSPGNRFDCMPAEVGSWVGLPSAISSSIEDISF